MDLDLLISVFLSEDGNTLTIKDNGTDWSNVTPNMSEIDAINIKFYGVDKNEGTDKYNYNFTSLERETFLTEKEIKLNINDGSMAFDYPVDNFYSIRLLINNSLYSNFDDIGINRILSNNVFKRLSTTASFDTIRDEFNRLTGAVIGLDVLTSLILSFDPEREIKWRDVYDYVANTIKL